MTDIFNCQHYSHLLVSYSTCQIFSLFPAYFLPLLLASPTHSKPAERVHSCQQCRHCCGFSFLFRGRSLLLLPGCGSPTNSSHPRRVPSGSSSKHQEAKWLRCMGQYNPNLTHPQLDILEIAFDTWDEPVKASSLLLRTLSPSSLDAFFLEESNSFEDTFSSSLDAVSVE